MRSRNLGRSFAAGIAAIAAFNTLSALSMPVADRRVSGIVIALWLVLLVVHAIAYWHADALRARLHDPGYFALQGTLVFAVGLARAPFPVGVGLYIALTVFAVIVVGERWGSVLITFGAIVLFAINAIVTSNLYQGATAGLLLAVAGVIGHAIAALVRRSTPAETTAPERAPARTAALDVSPRFGLTARELEVLRALSIGARNSAIATQLGITERTVKAHLASIYTKLGVESRTAAVSFAAQNGLVGKNDGR